MPYYDREGKPMSMIAWATALGDIEQRAVVSDERGDVIVSTVWVGLNHRFGPGAPLIFETMVFGGINDGDCQRYSTEDEARAGHAEVLATELAEGTDR